MYWDKEIRFRITTRRIMVAILMASTVANLVIVGTVFGTVPTTSTPTLTALVTFTTSTQFQTTTSVATASVTIEVFTSTSVSNPSVTITSTETPTNLPTLAMCVLRNYWPTYYAQEGDTLFALARATGSTVEELMLANCLSNQEIRAGQLLYVPRAHFNATTSPPSVTPTGTPTTTLSTTLTNTPTDTPTNTQTATPTNTPSATATDTITPTSTNIVYQLY